MARDNVQINAVRLNENILSSCQWGSLSNGGMCTNDIASLLDVALADYADLMRPGRLAAGDDDGKVRAWFIAECRKYGCEIKVDQLGNIFAIRPGQNNDIAPVALGSHLDTQPSGGKYDGILGICCALEVLATLHEADITTYAPLAIVDWTNEEGARFLPSMLGSGVWCGKYTVDFAHERSDADGNKLGDELRRIGYLDSGSIECSHSTNPLSAHLEVHIEQGPVLDENEESVAVVRGVQAIRWYEIQLTGRESHAGTTPMNRRRDALLAAARVIDSVNRIATTAKGIAEGLCTTVGVVDSAPQAINTIAGQVRLYLDLRSPSDGGMAYLDNECRQSVKATAEFSNVEISLHQIFNSPALQFDNVASTCIREAAVGHGYKRHLVSGAGHDSMNTAKHCPTGMIFVRCKDGVSHNPSEYARPEDCAVGGQILLEAYLKLDEYLRLRLSSA